MRNATYIADLVIGAPLTTRFGPVTDVPTAISSDTFLPANLLAFWSALETTVRQRATAATEGTRFRILIPNESISGVPADASDAAEDGAEYLAFTAYANLGAHFACTHTLNAQNSTLGTRQCSGREVNGNRPFLNFRHGAFLRSDHSVTLHFSGVPEARTTYGPNSFVASLAAQVLFSIPEQPTVQFNTPKFVNVGADSTGSPLSIGIQVNSTSTGPEVFAYPKTRILIAPASRSVRIADDALQLVYEVPLNQTDERLALNFTLLRNLNLRVVREPLNSPYYSLQGYTDQETQVYRIDSTPNGRDLNFPPVVLQDASGADQLVTYNNTYLYFQAGFFNDIRTLATSAFPNNQISLYVGGNTQVTNGGFFELTVDGERAIRYYGNLAIIDNVNNILLPTFGSIQSPYIQIRPQDPVYQTMLSLVDSGRVVSLAAALEYGEPRFEFLARAQGEINYYRIQITSTGQFAVTITSDELLRQESQALLMYSLILQNEMIRSTALSSIFSAQFGATQTIVDNLAPTPVTYVYR